MKQTRRDFLKFSATAAISPFLMPALSFAADPGFSDYKALVCIFLKGGNDSVNMILPIVTTGEAGYDNYQTIRSNMAVANNDLSGLINAFINDSSGNVNLGTQANNPYSTNGVAYTPMTECYVKGMYKRPTAGIGINGLMPELAQLMTQNKLATVLNMGSLVQPVTRTTIKNNSAILPTMLFAHNHQQRVMQTGIANNLNSAGWAGRLFDAWSGVNNGSYLGMNTSFSGNNRMLIGNDTIPLVMDIKPQGYSSFSDDQRAIAASLGNQTRTNLFRKLYGDFVSDSTEIPKHLKIIWANSRTFNSTDSYGQPLFSVPKRTSQTGIEKNLPGSKSGSDNLSLIKRLEAVTKLIDHGKQSGLKRQIFFVEHTGYDTHSNQINGHSLLLRELSLAMHKFQTAVDEMGMTDEVTTFNMSDFGRSIGHNGAGTDHAWGGHYFVMGGAVNGNQSYGTMPSLNLEGTQDYGRKGRLIPEIATDQYLATLTKWFGADDALQAQLFPNLANFATKDLGFMSS
ncbi:MAG: DUF1501 domain-containing protein [Methylococcales bacterium]|nr:DUF1501 domain-containing protein [Methylococcales bacterium]MCK5924725.1 DUF1501 domain-containing protein [Methylococcales bacterium]